MESHDVAAVFVDEIGLAGSLPMSCLVSTEATCRLISIYGLLSRDFRRELSTGLLSPTPYFYANECAVYGPGYTGIGAVTGTRNGGAKAGSASWDSGCGRSPPHLERFVSEDSERGAGCEMALDIESVVDDGVSGEEALG